MDRRDCQLQIRYKSLFIPKDEIQTLLENDNTSFCAYDESTADRSYKYYPDDQIYVTLMEDILAGYPHFPCAYKPVELLERVWLGSTADADESLVNRYRFTHILNLHGHKGVGEMPIRPPTYSKDDTKVKKTRVFACYDLPNFNMIGEFPQAFFFIDQGRTEGGKVLIYSKGQNCSGALAIGYLMQNGHTLLEATRKLKETGHASITNTAFIKQLVQFARLKGLLDPNPESIKVRKYGNVVDRHRLLDTVANIKLGRQRHNFDDIRY